MKKYILLGLLCAICTTSCLYKDLGNYDYDLLPEMKITGIEKYNGVKQQFRDILEIKPQVSFGVSKDSDFEHAWYLRSGNSFTLLTTEPNLSYKLVIKGPNHFRYKVTHKKTGLSIFYDTSCDVVAETERGWYFLKETADGETDMDAQFVTTEGTYGTLNENIIRQQEGASLSGKPIGLDWGNYRYMQVTEDSTKLVTVKALFPTSTREIQVYDIASLSKIADFEDLVGEIPIDERRIESLYSGTGGTQALIHNGGRLRVRMSSGSSKFYPEYAQEEYAMHKKPMTAGGGAGMWFFNRTTSSTIIANYGSSLFLKYKKDYGFPLLNGTFPINNHGCDLVYFLRSDAALIANKAPGTAYMILRKIEHPDSVFICHMETFNLAANTSGNMNPIQKSDTLQAKNYKFLSADHVTMHQDGGLLYFSKGAKIGLYYLGLKSEQADLLDLSADSDEITWFKYLKKNYGNFNVQFQGLVVATHRAGKYQVRVFPILSGGKPDTNPSHTFPGEGLYGEGKVVDGKFVDPNAYPIHIYY